MYRCFKITVQKSDFCTEKLEQIEKWKKQGEHIKAELQQQVEEILSEVTNSEGVISGEELSKTWFPVENKDVFLSYSHKDEETALIIAGILKDVFGLNVFIDALVWGSADGLLKAIDDVYCMKVNGSYSYEKRNFSTSHVHAMLMTSIMRAMDQAEVIFFLNTSNSTYKLKDGFSDEHTLSPWIYGEITCATLLREKSWELHRNKSMNENAQFEKRLNVAYPLKMDGFTEISFMTLVEWWNAWNDRKNKSNGQYGGLFIEKYKSIKHPLNVLYEMMFGVEAISENV